jgi:predicted nuclease of predicted toxin-antitoxin system
LRLLANDNFPWEAVEALRKDGYDVTWVRTDCPGITDTNVLRIAHPENRIVLTFDKDFGESAFRSGMHRAPGVILFRVALRSPGFVARLAVTALRSRMDWAGHFSVVQENRVRMIPLPGTAR